MDAFERFEAELGNYVATQIKLLEALSDPRRADAEKAVDAMDLAAARLRVTFRSAVRQAASEAEDS